MVRRPAVCSSIEDHIAVALEEYVGRKSFPLWWDPVDDPARCGYIAWAAADLVDPFRRYFPYGREVVDHWDEHGEVHPKLDLFADFFFTGTYIRWMPLARYLDESSPYCHEWYNWATLGGPFRPLDTVSKTTPLFLSLNGSSPVRVEDPHRVVNIVRNFINEIHDTELSSMLFRIKSLYPNQVEGSGS